MAIIERTSYIDHITSRMDRGMMIFLIGQHRVGKSYMLRQLRSWIEKNRPDSTIVYINKELQAFNDITNAEELYQYASPLMSESNQNYLLIDEVQDIDQYENALRSFHAEERCQIVATGSNAYVFSSELSTRLGGRYIEIPIYSLSYSEFLIFHKLEDSDKSLNTFLRVGGLPGLCHFDIDDEAQVRDYLQGVYNTIMMKDIILREKIRNITFIENLSAFIADNIGKLVSVSNIVKYMKSQGEQISEPLTSTYLNYLCKALLINRVSRYDIHGKRLFEQNFKYYYSDHGLRNLMCGFNLIGSVEKIIENVLYNYLRMQEFDVTVGILRAGEVDFVAKRGADRIYIQATYLLASEETVRREFGNLAGIKDNYPKYVISMDPVSGELSEYPGIRHMKLRDFLKLRL